MRRNKVVDRLLHVLKQIFRLLQIIFGYNKIQNYITIYSVINKYLPESDKNFFPCRNTRNAFSFCNGLSCKPFIRLGAIILENRNIIGDIFFTFYKIN